MSGTALMIDAKNATVEAWYKSYGAVREMMGILATA
jgi:hypothetical protein